MTTPSTDGSPSGDLPYLPPARPAAPPPATPGAATPSAAAAPADAPHLPDARPPAPTPAPAAASFDAKAMVESQHHYNPNPAYGAMPTGTDESRAAARKLREQANRKRRRGRVLTRVFGLVLLAGVAVGGWFAYQAIQDDPPPLDRADATDDVTDGGDGEAGALTPLGEQEQVIEVLDDLNSGATPSAGGLLDAVEDARDAVGQAQPPVASPDEPAPLLVADVFTPAVLDHTDVLGAEGGIERFVVRTADLVAINPSAHTALLDRLLALPQVADGDPQLALAPVVLPGDVAIAIERDGDRIVRIVAVDTDPVIRAVGP